MASTKCAESHITKEAFLTLVCRCKKKKKKFSKVLFHLLNIPFHCGFLLNRERVFKDLQEKYFIAVLFLSSPLSFAYDIYREKDTKSKMGVFTFKYGSVMSVLLLVYFE